MKTFIIQIGLIVAAVCSQFTIYAQGHDKSAVWVTIENENAAPTHVNGKLISSDASVQALIEEYSLVSIEKALPDSRKESLEKVYEITCLCNGDALAVALNRNNVFSKADQAPEYELLSSGADPDDYLLNFNEDYALDLIGATTAWDYTTGDSEIVIGVSDGSFLTLHEDLQNKYVSVVNSQTASMNFFYHGTAVATVAAGNTNNGVGKSAIGYNCQLALNTIGYNQLLQLAYGGARVINLSWTSGCFYNVYYQDIIDEVNEQGAIIVASAGNGSTCGGASNLVYPSALDGVISVTSVGPNDNHERAIGDSTTTHQHNSTVDLCAPGYDVALTIAPGNYMTGNGSSFAAPYVTGTIGLMLSLRPCLTGDEVLEILQATSVDIYGGINSNYTGLLGAGRLDAGAAVAYVNGMNACFVKPVTPTVVGSGVGVISANPGTGTLVVGSGTGPLVVGSGTGDISVNNDNDPIIGGNENGNGNRMGAEDETSILNEDEMMSFEAVLFPNPTNSQTSIRWNQNIDFELQMFDSKGSLVLTKAVSKNGMTEKLSAPMKGLYYVKFVREGVVIWSDKLVKM